MGKTSAPIDYESLIRLIHNRYDDMSRSHREIATYLTQNPNEVAVRAVNSISQSCGIHASSFVRFAQSLGFDGFKSLQEVFQQRLATAAPGFEARVYALNQELRSRSKRPESDLLVDMVVSDAASIQSLLDEVDGRDVARAGEIIGDADTVFFCWDSFDQHQLLS